MTVVEHDTSKSPERNFLAYKTQNYKFTNLPILFYNTECEIFFERGLLKHVMYLLA